MANFTLYFDGHSERDTVSFGWELLAHGGEVKESDSGTYSVPSPGLATAELARWNALGKALTDIKRLRLIDGPDDVLEIRSPDQPLVHRLAKRWKCPDARVEQRRDRCVELLTAVGCGWEVEWCPPQQSARAADLSVAAWELATDRPFPHPRPAQEPPRADDQPEPQPAPVPADPPHAPDGDHPPVDRVPADAGVATGPVPPAEPPTPDAGPVADPPSPAVGRKPRTRKPRPAPVGDGAGAAVGGGPAVGGAGGDGVGGEPQPAGVTDAAAFDGDTPPPKRRPMGLPLKPYVTLPAGETAATSFRVWDREGRTPPGAVLMRRVSRVLEPEEYEVAANPAGSEPFGPAGSRVPAAAVERWPNVAVVVEHGRPMSPLVVMAPGVAHAAG